MSDMDEFLLRSSFGEDVDIVSADRQVSPLDFLFSTPTHDSWSESKDRRENASSRNEPQLPEGSYVRPFYRRRAGPDATLFRDKEAPETFLDIAAASDVAYQSYAEMLPLSIWTCCQKRCFQCLACSVDPKTKRFLSHVLEIRKAVNALIKNSEGIFGLIRVPRPLIRLSDPRVEQEACDQTYFQFCISVYDFLTGKRGGTASEVRFVPQQYSVF